MAHSSSPPVSLSITHDYDQQWFAHRGPRTPTSDGGRAADGVASWSPSLSDEQRSPLEPYLSPSLSPAPSHLPTPVVAMFENQLYIHEHEEDATLTNLGLTGFGTYHDQYPPHSPQVYNAEFDNTLSPLSQSHHLPQDGLLKLPEYRKEEFDPPHPHNYASDDHHEPSLLFGGVSSSPRPSIAHYDGPAFAHHTQSAISCLDMRSSVASGEFLMIPSTRNYRTGPSSPVHRTREGTPSTPGSDSSFLVFSSSPSLSADEPLGPTSPVQHAVVGSVAGTQAASRRRKNKPSFRCKFEACSATFTANHNLKNHMNSHYGIRPYGCPKCDATFTTPAVKSRHFKSCKGFRSKRSSSAQGSSSPTSY